MILVGHNITELRKLPEKSVHCVVTSPPYWGLRAYGTEPQVWGGDIGCEHEWELQVSRAKTGGNGKSSSLHIGSGLTPAMIAAKLEAQRVPEQQNAVCGKCGAWCGELGSEPTPEMFVSHMVDVFAEVWRVLRDDGTCWVNLGDSYASAWVCSRRNVVGNKSLESGKRADRPNRLVSGLKEKDLIGIPWRVAFGLQAAGWYLRQDIIWHKPNPMPESVNDRCTKGHEYLFLLTKSPRYFFDRDAIDEACSPSTHARLSQDVASQVGSARANGGGKTNGNMKAVARKFDPSAGNKNNASFDAAMAIMPERRNKRTVWSISTHSYKGAHFATFPPRLVEPCIMAGTSAAGCCPSCGKPWARVVESQRVATRPGQKTKIGGTPNWTHVAGDDRVETMNERLPAEVVGNRDPQRHVAVKVTTGWKQSCQCEGAEAVPCVVLDPFGGSGTTAIVAAYHGRNWLLCELNEKYAELARARIAEGWTPPKAKKPRKKKPGSVSRQLNLIVD